MAHRKGHFDSTTFRRMKDKFNEEQLESNDSDIVGGKLDFPQFSFRGKDAYNTTMQAADGIGDPYSYDNKRDANDKKYPLLSSRHHTGDFYNPMQTTSIELCGTSPTTCVALEQTFQYLGHKWSFGACGLALSLFAL